MKTKVQDTVDHSRNMDTSNTRKRKKDVTVFEMYQSNAHLIEELNKEINNSQIISKDGKQEKKIRFRLPRLNTEQPLNHFTPSSPLELSEGTQSLPFTRDEVSSLLKSYERVVSIWIPPSSYPQLLGLLTYNMVEARPNQKFFHIKRHYWYRHGMTKKFFSSLLKWARAEHNADAIALTTTKENFNGIYRECGWEAGSWKHGKLKILFKGYVM